VGGGVIHNLYELESVKFQSEGPNSNICLAG
jgi:hypothetical protein